MEAMYKKAHASIRDAPERKTKPEKKVTKKRYVYTGFFKATFPILKLFRNG